MAAVLWRGHPRLADQWLRHLPHQARTSASRPPKLAKAELEAPLPYALVSDRDAPPGQEQFNVPETQAEDVVQPGRVADDLGREAVSGISGGLGRHPASMPQRLRSGQRLRSW